MVDKKTAAQIRNDLRRRWRWSKERKAALKRAFHHSEPMVYVIRGKRKTRYVEFYTCEKCKVVVRRKDKQVDHLEPVICPETGFTTWDNYIDRLWAEAGKLMVLCLTCHAAKTKSEGVVRTATRRSHK